MFGLHLFSFNMFFIQICLLITGKKWNYVGLYLSAKGYCSNKLCLGCYSVPDRSKLALKRCATFLWRLSVWGSWNTTTVTQYEEKRQREGSAVQRAVASWQLYLAFYVKTTRLFLCFSHDVKGWGDQSTWVCTVLCSPSTVCVRGDCLSQCLLVFLVNDVWNSR